LFRAGLHFIQLLKLSNKLCTEWQDYDSFQVAPVASSIKMWSFKGVVQWPGR